MNIPNNGMVWQELHEVELTVDEEGGLICHCEECGRKLRFVGGKMQVIQKGDVMAAHSGSLGGLAMGAIIIEGDAR